MNTNKRNKGLIDKNIFEVMIMLWLSTLISIIGLVTAIIVTIVYEDNLMYRLIPTLVVSVMASFVNICSMFNLILLKKELDDLVKLDNKHNETLE